MNKPFNLAPYATVEELKVNISGVGVFPVRGGAITMEKYQVGREGNDWWDGKIQLLIDTSTGPQTINGTFSMCIVPVW